MKKWAFLAAGITVLAGCNNDNSVKAESLLHHRFVLVEANGETIQTDETIQTPFLEFGENFNINGRMCNNFFGQAVYESGKISSQQLASTFMLCPSEQLNKLDTGIAVLFKEGAKPTLQNNKLTLTSENQTFVFELKDLVN